MDPSDIQDRLGDGLPFVNVKSDYGFKWFFGQLKRKHILIRYLNAIFERAGRNIVVEDVAYHDKEMLPDAEGGKKIIYDIYCSTPDNHHFIVEMQNVDEPMFENLVIYYTAKISSDQGVAGWNYDLEPMFSIIVSNFNVKGMPSRLFHDIVLYDKETGSIFSDRINIFFICLPELPETWDECKTEFERLTYLVDRIGTLTRDSEEYKIMGYTDFFRAAEKTNMSDSEYVLYSQSRDKEEAVKRGMEYARQQAMIEGRAEGKLSQALQIARNMITAKMDLPSIAKLCGLDIEQVRKLSAEM